MSLITFSFWLNKYWDIFEWHKTLHGFKRLHRRRNFKAKAAFNEGIRRRKGGSIPPVTASLKPNKACNRNKILWLSFRDKFSTSISSRATMLTSVLNDEPPCSFWLCICTQMNGTSMLTCWPLTSLDLFMRGQQWITHSYTPSCFCNMPRKSNPHCLPAGDLAKG